MIFHGLDFHEQGKTHFKCKHLPPKTDTPKTIKTKFESTSGCLIMEGGGVPAPPHYCFGYRV